MNPHKWLKCERSINFSTNEISDFFDKVTIPSIVLKSKKSIIFLG